MWFKERIFTILRTPEFRSWYEKQTEKTRVQVDDRLSKIQDDGYFGDHKTVSENDEIWELKWKNGRRVYYALISEKEILVLAGGNKNGQDKDIRKAKNIYKKHTY
jgi:putative addiction module killer protein